MLAIGSDLLLSVLRGDKKYLDEKGIAYKDFGTYSEESTDYPIYGEAVAKAVARGECEKAILICGTGWVYPWRLTRLRNTSRGLQRLLRQCCPGA